MTQRILLLGATGRTGSLALGYALSQGFEVVVLVHHQAAISVRSNLKYTFQDHDTQESELRDSGTAWTAVCAAGLSNCKTLKSLAVSYNNHPMHALRIARLQTARYLIDCLNDKTTFGKTPVISGR